MGHEVQSREPEMVIQRQNARSDKLPSSQFNMNSVNPNVIKCAWPYCVTSRLGLGIYRESMRVTACIHCWPILPCWGRQFRICDMDTSRLIELQATCVLVWMTRNKSALSTDREYLSTSLGFLTCCFVCRLISVPVRMHAVTHTLLSRYSVIWFRTFVFANLSYLFIWLFFFTIIMWCMVWCV